MSPRSEELKVLLGYSNVARHWGVSDGTGAEGSALRGRGSFRTPGGLIYSDSCLSAFLDFALHRPLFSSSVHLTPIIEPYKVNCLQIPTCIRRPNKLKWSRLKVDSHLHLPSRPGCCTVLSSALSSIKCYQTLYRFILAPCIVKIVSHGQQNQGFPNDILGQFLFVEVTRAVGPLSFIIRNMTYIDMACGPTPPPRRPWSWQGLD
jgi:hypothetical protein